MCVCVFHRASYSYTTIHIYIYIHTYMCIRHPGPLPEAKAEKLAMKLICLRPIYVLLLAVLNCCHLC